MPTRPIFDVLCLLPKDRMLKSVLSVVQDVLLVPGAVAEVVVVEGAVPVDAQAPEPMRSHLPHPPMPGCPTLAVMLMCLGPMPTGGLGNMSSGARTTSGTLRPSRLRRHRMARRPMMDRTTVVPSMRCQGDPSARPPRVHRMQRKGLLPARQRKRSPRRRALVAGQPRPAREGMRDGLLSSRRSWTMLACMSPTHPSTRTRGCLT